MILTSVLVFFVFLLLSAFFSASETAFLSLNPYTLDLLEKKGSRRARLIKMMLARVDQLLATILVGNTLVNIAAGSVATLFFLSIMPGDRNQAALLATLATTLFILVFAEINPKTFAAYYPLKLSRLVIQPIRLFFVLFYPLVKAFTLTSRIFFKASPEEGGRKSSPLNEEEIKLLLTKGVAAGDSGRRNQSSVLSDHGDRPGDRILAPAGLSRPHGQHRRPHPHQGHHPLSY